MKASKLASVMAALLLGGAASAVAKDGGPVKLGVLTDMTSVFSAAGGQGSVEAVKIAIDEVGGKVLGKPIELVSADFQLKIDLALSITREWLDRSGVDAIFDVSNSGPARAVNEVVGERKRLAFISNAAIGGGEDCNGYGLGWLYNPASIYRSAVSAQLSQGKNRWFLFIPDTPWGSGMEAGIRKELAKGGGAIVGAIKYSQGTKDFSSFLLQAQASNANFVVSINAGPDFINIMKQAQEFGLESTGKTIGGMSEILTDVKSTGLDIFKGKDMITAWYWDMDDKSREFADRFFKRTGKRPTNMQAAGYSAALQYLHAVEKLGTTNAEKVFEYLKSIKIEDAYSRNGVLRDDGRLIHDMYLVRAKQPAQSKNDWDLYEMVKTIPAEDAYGPLNESGCKAIKSN